ncbi:tRNA (adenosine(37)-N6)-threonylcarbamoyltransferase complex transferase subunit TsaD [Suicoccus acidiformans]|uniref:tRNA N6-adenosine threonylcarbamoyltransferase n=1 Tax=Suicoccus acidiformans TaxID=2036206 RepID=A0A347WHX5_9LACT|nr:tRNA (adenosine(37)-N6)-threonylcarbamoyltransferase complex transferase subunit TsaD [Suicoccus acidiformans]AXY24682.1 tRNA (adenosine(37)-N6)-threonylcarbamoyltransferase complex transferase subunit TsaD [Suicoccus acidiformans]
MAAESLILAIESSCDETSVAIIEDGRNIRSNVVASQVKSHMRFGGVVPEVASRHHVEQITQVIDLALREANVSLADVDAVAVTEGPGLVGSLLVGITAAKTLAFAHNKPLIGVNHLAGHIYAGQFMAEMKFPLLALIASGGHTELVYMSDHLNFEVIGETQDDAVGEAYDKVGRILDLPYPAGKYMDQLAQEGEATYDIPRGMIHEENLNFSFSGMKSAVMNLVHNAKQRGDTIHKSNLAASFQEAAVEVLVKKTSDALKLYPDVQQFILAGGVAANSGLRQGLQAMLKADFPKLQLIIPDLKLCGDNAAMIGATAHQHYLRKDFASLALNARPGLMLGEE